MRVCLIAAPLEARSGVYRSTHDLVREARAQGLDWSAVVGMRASAATTTQVSTPGVTEVIVRSHGRSVLAEVRRILNESDDVAAADVIITLITQSDIAVSDWRERNGRPWVAFIRGLPWPARGEQSTIRRLTQTFLETRALRQADEVWATTDVLAAEIAGATDALIIPAGVPARARTHFGETGEAGVVWAGRMAVDKKPLFFADIMRTLPYPARMFGEGRLLDDVRADAPENVKVVGWVDPEELWNGAMVFAGTSSREAFGRSAVEAALRGVPVVLGNNYGAGPLLFSDPELRQRFLISVDDARAWRAAISDLMSDSALRKKVSDHVHSNAESLTISSSVEAANRRLAVLAGELSPR